MISSRFMRPLLQVARIMSFTTTPSSKDLPQSQSLNADLAPQVQIHPTSPFNAFVADHKDMKGKERFRELGVKWKALSPQEREKYTEMAKKLTEQRVLNPPTPKMKFAVIERTVPTRKQTVFATYLTQTLKQQPGSTHKDRFSNAAKAWKALTNEEKEKYRALTAEANAKRPATRLRRQRVPMDQVKLPAEKVKKQRAVPKPKPVKVAIPKVLKAKAKAKPKPKPRAVAKPKPKPKAKAKAKAKPKAKAVAAWTAKRIPAWAPPTPVRSRARQTLNSLPARASKGGARYARNDNWDNDDDYSLRGGKRATSNRRVLPVKLAHPMLRRR
eukprot:EG_transcript_14291